MTRVSLPGPPRTRITNQMRARRPRRRRGRGGRIADGILDAIGNTPLVRLQRLMPGAPVELYAKLESLNPSGSMKDRPAWTILTDALERGALAPGGPVIESSSGNFAIALAQACAYLGLRLTVVVDAKTTRQNVAILRAYGAEIEVVSQPDATTGELLPARLSRVRELLRERPGAFWPNQYANAMAAGAHHQTIREIERDLGRLPDYVMCATGTCATLRGCSEYVRARGSGTVVVAVDALGSAIFGSPAGKRLIPGHGAAVRPPLHDDGLADRVIHVSDRESVAGCRRLVEREAILAGGSGGAVVSALERLLPELEPGCSCVIVLADRGERYLDTIYSDEWVGTCLGAPAAAGR